MTTQAQTFQAPQSHAAFRNPLRQSYRYHNPLVLSTRDQADLEIARACVQLDASLQPNGLTPCEVHHYRAAVAVSALIDESNEIEARIQAKQDMIDAWIAGEATYEAVQAAHAPSPSFVTHYVRRAYAVLSFVGGNARVR